MTNNQRNCTKPAAESSSQNLLPLHITDAILPHNHAQQDISMLPRRVLFCFCAIAVCFIELFATELVFAAPAAAVATLNFDQGIADGVNPITKLILTHNGKAIFLSGAFGTLLGGLGSGDGWARLKMGGLWMLGAAALIQIAKGTLGVAMPG